MFYFYQISIFILILSTLIFFLKKSTMKVSWSSAYSSVSSQRDLTSLDLPIFWDKTQQSSRWSDHQSSLTVSPTTATLKISSNLSRVLSFFWSGSLLSSLVTLGRAPLFLGWFSVFPEYPNSVNFLTYKNFYRPFFDRWEIVSMFSLSRGDVRWEFLFTNKILNSNLFKYSTLHPNCTENVQKLGLIDDDLMIKSMNLIIFTSLKLCKLSLNCCVVFQI